MVSEGEVKSPYFLRVWRALHNPNPLPPNNKILILKGILFKLQRWLRGKEELFNLVNYIHLIFRLSTNLNFVKRQYIFFFLLCRFSVFIRCGRLSFTFTSFLCFHWCFNRTCCFLLFIFPLVFILVLVFLSFCRCFRFSFLC